jgi:hypothetical protein
MKKFLAKLALFAIISLILISLNPGVVFGNNLTEKDIKELEELKKERDKEYLLNAFEEVSKYEQFCIQDRPKDKETPGDDEGYLITIVEEPLTLDESKEKTSDTPKPDFEVRICYRNYLTYMKDGTRKTVSILAKKCDKFIREFDPEDWHDDLKIGVSCDPVQVYLSKGGTTLLQNYISTIYRWAASLVGIIAVVVIVISGIQISVAGGDTQAIDNAKTRIIQSLTAIAILFLSALILYTLNPTFFTK